MHRKFGKADVSIGTSACLMGKKIKFGAGNKLSSFCIKELTQHATFKDYCPEVAVYLPCLAHYTFN